MWRMVRDLLTTIGTFLLVVVGGVLAFLSIAPVFGYLPHSDRPGAGWFGTFPAITWTQFWRSASYGFVWSVFLAPYVAGCAVILFVIARVMDRLGANRGVIAVVGAILGASMCGYVVGLAGWYIALAAPAVYVSMLLGAACGAWLLPRKSGSGAKRKEVVAPRGAGSSGRG